MTFLFGRKQRVIVNGKPTTWADVLSGIPQGSVFGPILFVIFINDLPEMVYSTAKIFADDTKLFRTITSEGDRHRLQEYLKHLVIWSEKWQLGFNEGKCKVLHFGNSNPRHVYHMVRRKGSRCHHRRGAEVPQARCNRSEKVLQHACLASSEQRLLALTR